MAKRSEQQVALGRRAARMRRIDGLCIPAQVLENAPVVGYRRVVDRDKAAVVLDVFTMYAHGMNPKRIARELNRRGIPSPAADWKRKHRAKRQDAKWMGSAIYAMLDNELYAGRVVWNKSRWERDPDTGHRVRRSRPESEWVVQEDESLRIVPDALWRKVKARQKQVARENANVREAIRVLNNGNPAGRKPSNFWSGLLVCGVCGRNFIKVSKYQYGCGSYANGGEHACGNNLRARASMLDDKILTAVKTELLSDERLRKMEQAMRAHIERRMRELAMASAHGQIEARLSEIEPELKRVADAIAKVGINETLSAKLDELTAEKKRLAAEQKTAKVDPRLGRDIAKALPALMRRNVEIVEQLGTNTRKLTPRVVYAAQRAMEKLTGKIELRPARSRRSPHLVAKLELTDERVALLAEEAFAHKTKKKQGAMTFSKERLHSIPET